jgi:23S rRNA (cytidine1920-2'-O)/16S rRNA (cytidine1409-2'-O)-methyltransferase
MNSDDAIANAGREQTPEMSFVSRGGLKLLHAIRTWNLDVRGKVCADLGCSTGGFTDCLLKHGAARVHSVDTGYGVIDYRLRTNPAVHVMERSNALHVAPAEPVDVVVFDLSWTPQRLAVPAALRWLKGDPAARMVSLIKPHYEDKALAAKHRGLLPDAEAARVAERVVGEMGGLGVEVLGWTASPIRGGSQKKATSGNVEYLALLRVAR